MNEFASDFGLSLHDAGRAGARVSFSRVLLPHIGRIDEDAYCSTANLTMEREFAVTFDFDRVALRELLSLLSSAAAGLGARLTRAFQEPEMIEFSKPLVVGIDATVGTPIENADERYAPFRVRAFRAADTTTRIEIEDASAPSRNRGAKRT